jgi:hypothetical protein
VLFAIVQSSCVRQNATVPPPTPAPFVEMRLASTGPRPGYTLRAEELGEGMPRRIYEGPSIITDADFVNIRSRPIRDSSGIDIQLMLSGEAATRMRETLARHLREYAVILIDGKLEAASLIVEAIPGPGNNVLSMQLERSRRTTDSLQARIVARWPRPDQWP